MMSVWHSSIEETNIEDDIRELHTEEAIEKFEEKSCGTAHCRAGWAIHLAGKAGYDLELKVGPRNAGALIYQASAGYVPDFFCTTEEALDDIQETADEETADEGK